MTYRVSVIMRTKHAFLSEHGFQAIDLVGSNILLGSLTQILDTSAMDDQQLLRYSRQIMLPQVDIEGQETLLRATVLIIGMGGLGSPAAMYLASAGIGKLVLVDDDDVELSNLQRQIIHGTASLGEAKVSSAMTTLKQLNPEVELVPVAKRLDKSELEERIAQTDVVVDCTDNFESRFLINDACIKIGRTLVSGAAIRTEGHLSVFNHTTSSPCYRCLYKDEGELQESCSETGILAPVVGTIGCLQAIETIKILLNTGEPLDGRLLVFDALSMEFRTIRLRKDPDCPVCSV